MTTATATTSPRAVVAVAVLRDAIVARDVLKDREWIGRAANAKMRIAGAPMLGRIHVGVEIGNSGGIRLRHSGTTNPVHLDGVSLRTALPLAPDRASVVDVAQLRILVRPATIDPLLGASWWLTRDALAFEATLLAPFGLVWRLLRFDEQGSPRDCAGVVDELRPPATVARPALLDGDPDGVLLRELVRAPGPGSFDPAIAAAVAHGANDYVEDVENELVVSFDGAVTCVPARRVFPTKPQPASAYVADRMRAAAVAVAAPTERASREQLAAFVQGLFAERRAKSRAIVEQALMLDANAWSARVPGRPA